MADDNTVVVDHFRDTQPKVPGVFNPDGSLVSAALSPSPVSLGGTPGTGGDIDLSDYALKTDLTNFVTMGQVTNAISGQLTDVVTTAQLTTALNGRVTSTELTQALSNRVTTAQLTQVLDDADFAKASDLPDFSEFAKTEDVPDASDFLTTDTVQTVTGKKTFTSDVVIGTGTANRNLTLHTENFTNGGIHFDQGDTHVGEIKMTSEYSGFVRFRDALLDFKNTSIEANKTLRAPSTSSSGNARDVVTRDYLEGTRRKRGAVTHVYPTSLPSAGQELRVTSVSNNTVTWGYVTP